MARKRSLLIALTAAATLATAAPALSAQNAKPAHAPKAEAKAEKTANTTTTAANIGGAQPALLGQYGEWGAYTASPGGRKICFALAKPAKAATEPPNRPRDPAYMFIATRPAEKVNNEVSVIVGYGMKPSADAVVDVGGAKFAMYTQNDGAWIKNAAEEPRLVDAMRKGADVVVRAESARGTRTTDVYSLKGLSQALDRVSQECK